jgi:hypothetical protein
MPPPSIPKLQTTPHFCHETSFTALQAAANQQVYGVGWHGGESCYLYEGKAQSTHHRVISVFEKRPP